MLTKMHLEVLLGPEGDVLKRQHKGSGEWWRAYISRLIMNDIDSIDSERKQSISSSHGLPRLVVELALCEDLGLRVH